MSSERRCSIAAAAASPPSTTTAYIASPSAAATATSVPGSITSRSTNGPRHLHVRELNKPPTGRARTKTVVERVGTRAPRCRVGLGAPPTLLRRPKRELGRADQFFGVGEYLHAALGFNQLGLQRGRVGYECFDHALIGRRRELTLHAAVSGE